MILIFSDERDVATLEVIDWLCYYRMPFLRLNRENSISAIKIDLDKDDAFIELACGTSFYLHEVTVCWYRKGDLRLIIDKSIDAIYYSHLEQEWDTIVDFIIFLIEQKPHLGSYLKEELNNKLKNLSIAKARGLEVPSSLVTSSKEALLNFFVKKKTCITKSLHSDLYIENEKACIYTKGTILVTEEMIDGLDEHFFPSFVQEYVEKEYELRVFFLDGKCYSICIFSQSDEQTKVDQRNYNFDKINRMTPYQLPLVIEDKITNFMTYLGLNIGSLDFIVSPEGAYIFLEVNPIGQFTWVSRVGNYKLEKKIASVLMRKYVKTTQEKVRK